MEKIILIIFSLVASINWYYVAQMLACLYVVYIINKIIDINNVVTFISENTMKNKQEIDNIKFSISQLDLKNQITNVNNKISNCQNNINNIQNDINTIKAILITIEIRDKLRK